MRFVNETTTWYYFLTKMLKRFVSSVILSEPPPTQTHAPKKKYTQSRIKKFVSKYTITLHHVHTTKLK